MLCAIIHRMRGKVHAHLVHAMFGVIVSHRMTQVTVHWSMRHVDCNALMEQDSISTMAKFAGWFSLRLEIWV